jgi:hypothetical protein
LPERDSETAKKMVGAYTGMNDVESSDSDGFLGFLGVNKAKNK